MFPENSLVCLSGLIVSCLLVWFVFVFLFPDFWNRDKILGWLLPWGEGSRKIVVGMLCVMSFHNKDCVNRKLSQHRACGRKANSIPLLCCWAGLVCSLDILLTHLTGKPALPSSQESAKPHLLPLSVPYVQNNVLGAIRSVGLRRNFTLYKILSVLQDYKSDFQSYSGLNILMILDV